MRPQDQYLNIPTLNIGEEEVTNNKDKAKVFLEAFFPKMAEAKEENSIAPIEDIP
jgi:hypothetical protein